MATDPRVLPWEREGAAERAAFALADLLHATAQAADVEDRMVGLPDGKTLGRMRNGIAMDEERSGPDSGASPMDYG